MLPGWFTHDHIDDFISSVYIYDESLLLVLLLMSGLAYIPTC